MTKNQLSEIIINKSNDLAEKTMSHEQIVEKLHKYSNGSNNISNSDLAMFAYMESIDFSRNLLYSVLSDVLPLDD